MKLVDAAEGLDRGNQTEKMTDLVIVKTTIINIDAVSRVNSTNGEIGPSGTTTILIIPFVEEDADQESGVIDDATNPKQTEDGEEKGVDAKIGVLEGTVVAVDLKAVAGALDHHLFLISFQFLESPLQLPNQVEQVSLAMMNRTTEAFCQL